MFSSLCTFECDQVITNCVYNILVSSIPWGLVMYLRDFSLHM